MQEYHLVLDQCVVDKYNAHYFTLHPKARKKPIEHPYHPSLNTWIILPRIQMNQLKQKWKDFVIFWIDDLGLNGKMLNEFEAIFTTYMPTKRRIDCDNTVPKFILDSFTESGFIVDDDGKHLKSLTLKTGYDKENPRTEIDIICYDNEKEKQD